MKNLFKSSLVTLTTLLVINGCGSGGSTPSTDEQNLSNNNTQAVQKLYKGAVGAGDFVEAKFDTATNKLDFNISGAFADANNLHSGSYTLTNMFGNFYNYEENLLFFASNNLSVAHVEIDNNEFNFATLADIDTPAKSDLEGKVFNAGVFINGENPQVCHISFDSDNAKLGPCIGDSEVNVLNWDISGDKVLLKDDNDNVVAQGIMKKGIKRDTLVLDLVNVGGDSGIAIALENVALEATEVEDSATFKAMDIADDDIGFSEVDIKNENGTVQVAIKDLKEDGSIEASYNATLILNPSINGSVWNGVAQVNESPTEYALFSNEDGFFLSIDTAPEEDDFIFSFGSNKPLQ